MAENIGCNSRAGLVEWPPSNQATSFSAGSRWHNYESPDHCCGHHNYPATTKKPEVASFSWGQKRPNAELWRCYGRAWSSAVSAAAEGSTEFPFSAKKALAFASAFTQRGAG